MTEIIDVQSPFDGSWVGKAPVSDESVVEAAFAKAHDLFRDRRRWMSLMDRIGILTRARKLVADRRAELAMTVARESGKPLKDALIEVDRAADCLDVCVHELRSHAGEVVPMGVNTASAGRLAFTQFEPIGVVLGIAAFNHPFNLVMHQVAPAVAVGAPVIVKPSPKTPLSCMALLDIFAEAGLPGGWAQMVMPLELELIGRMVADARLGFLSFIGSAKVGWSLRAQLAPGARCALEHGGLAPVIVAEDADLADAVPRLARAAFWHAGQACVSAQRLYCHSNIARDVAERLGQAGAAMVTGDPSLMTTDVGPLISHQENDRVASWVQQAVVEGAQLVAGGNKISPSCHQNTVLLNPSPTSDISRREVFGPVVAVYAYDELDTAIAAANGLEFSFQAAVFTRDMDRALHVYRHLDGTAIMVNEHPLFRVDWMPFSGARQSGLGLGGIPHTMREMQTQKMMVWRSPALC